VTTSMSTAEPPAGIERVAIVGTGLIGTSVAMAAARAACTVSGWDADPAVAARAAARSGLAARTNLEEAVADADLVVVCTPIGAIAGAVSSALKASPTAIVTDAASIKSMIVEDLASLASSEDLARFVPGHPMGGSERSGPEHASASVVDGIIWVLSETEFVRSSAIEAVQSWVGRIGARPVVMDPGRHDRLVAFVSHLPQVASTTLMGLAATEEAGEPEMLLLAAGGFRDLTRLASSDPALWSDILIANREQIGGAIDLYVERLGELRDRVMAGSGDDVARMFGEAKDARLRLATKPTVRSGVSVLQVEIPDVPGALARIASVLAAGPVNIEDLQIVHSPEGGRGMVHLTVAAEAAPDATDVLTAGGYDPIRLA